MAEGTSRQGIVSTPPRRVSQWYRHDRRRSIFREELRRKRPAMTPTIQSLWVGKELGALQRLSVRSFLANRCHYHLYTYGPVAGVPEGVTLCDASAIVPESEVFAQPSGFGMGSYSGFSDFFRYRLLFERGGWWVDTDVVCLRPMDIPADYLFATERAPDGTTRTASCVIKAPARADFLAYCTEYCGGMDVTRFTWGQIGPELLDDAVWRFGLGGFRVPVNYFNPVDYFRFTEFTEPEFDFSRLVESFGVHLWHQMWRATNTDPWATWSRDSLIGMLKARYLEDETGSSPIARAE